MTARSSVSSVGLIVLSLMAIISGVSAHANHLELRTYGPGCKAKPNYLTATMDATVPNPLNKTVPPIFTTSQEVIDHVKPITLADPRKHTWDCVDGRQTYAVLGTPGGDMGEFVLSLAAYEKLLKKTLTEKDVYSVLKKWVNKIATAKRPFYMHSDEHSIHDIAAALGVDAEHFDPVHPGAKVNKTMLLELLTTPLHWGCGHLKLMATQPDKYMIRVDLVVAAVRAFFLLLWDPKYEPVLSFPYELLNHTEKALVILKPAFPNCINNLTAPVSTPDVVGIESFVYAPFNLPPYRHQIAAWFAKQLGKPQDEPKIYKATTALGDVGTAATVASLVYGRPIYTVTVTDKKFAPKPTKKP